MNTPTTTHRSPSKIRHVRVPDDLWQAALERARTEDTDLAKVIRNALREYVNR